MVYRKTLIIICFLILPLLLWANDSLIDDDANLPRSVGTALVSSDTDEINDQITDEIDDQITDEINDQITDDDTFSGKPPTTPSTRPKRIPTVTLDDVTDFVKTDRDILLQNKTLSEVNYHNIYKYNSYWITNTQLPINAYSKRMTNLGEISPYSSINQFTTLKNYPEGLPAFFTASNYPHEVSLTRIYAGLGELDKDFAHVTFRKNEFLTLQNLNFRGDFKAINDYQHRNMLRQHTFYEKTSDAYFLLKYSLFGIDVSGSYLDSSYEHANTDYLLSTGNTNTRSIPVSDSWTLYTFDITSKYLYAGILQSESKITSYTFDTRSYLVGTKYKDTYHDVNLSYQKNYDKILTEKSSDNILSLKYSLSIPFTVKNNAIPAENDTTATSVGDVAYRPVSTSISPKPKYSLTTDIVTYDDYSKKNTITQLSAHIYKNSFFIGQASYADMHRPDIDYLFENYLTRSYQAGFAYITLTDRDYFWIDGSLLAGNKDIKQVEHILLDTPPSTLSESFHAYTAEINANVLMFDQYLANISNITTYDDFSTMFYYLPHLKNITDISITRHLQRNNRITLGSTINIVSSVYKYDEYEDLHYKVPQNHCIDVYFSIGITKLFDIKVLVNNLSRRGYYGNDYLDDFHFTTNMTWYFLN